MTTQTTLPAVLWDMRRTHADRRNTAYSTSGLYLRRDSGELFAVVTDGRRMAVYRERDDGPEISPRIVSAGSMRKFPPNKTVWRAEAAIREDGVLVHRSARGDVPLETDPGQMPPVETLIPPLHPGEAVAGAIHVNAGFLRDAGDLIFRFGKRAGDKRSSARWSHTRHNRTLRIDALKGQARMTVVMMPMRGDDPEGATEWHRS